MKTPAGADSVQQLELFGSSECGPPPLMFIAVCTYCGRSMEPVPAEGQGETWNSAVQWIYLGLKAHEETCQAIEGR